jgi:GNAT superfamily N-acetyltransferase
VTLTIRAARDADAETIAQFQERMALETEDLRLEPATVRRGVRAVLADPSRGAYWIAQRAGEAGEVVGCLLTVPEWSDWRDGTVLWIHSVYVVPGARRTGVFSALYAHLRRRVEQSSKLRGLRLYVDRDNDRAQRVYRALGMDGEHYRLYEWMKG